MKRDGSKATYSLIEYTGHNEKYQGQKVRLYEDGCIRDSKGYMVEKHPDGVEITHENASQLRTLRYEKAAEKLRDAIFTEASSYLPNINGPADAFAAGGAALYTKVIDAKMPKAIEYKILSEMAGFVPREKELEQAQGGSSGGSDSEIRGILRDLADIARKIPAVDVIDVDVE